MSLNSPTSDWSRPESGDVEIVSPAVGLSGQLLRLSTQADHLQVQLDQLTADVQSSSFHVEALTRYLTDPSVTQLLDGHLVELMTRMETSQERFDELVQQLNVLNGAVTKLTRTQFKNNTLAETKDQHVSSALATLQEIATRREEAKQATLLQASAHLADLRSEARGELAVDLLPALDGLELALESGHALLERQSRHAEAAASNVTETAHLAPIVPSRSEGPWHKLRRVLLGQPELPFSVQGVERPVAITDDDKDALEGWLHGLELVRERFLALLALEDIRPIEAQGRPFDPRLHVAMETEIRADMPQGTVVAMVRKGYRRRERVLRYAEVVVSRTPEERNGLAPEAVAGPEQAAGSQEGDGADVITSEEDKR